MEEGSNVDTNTKQKMSATAKAFHLTPSQAIKPKKASLGENGGNNDSKNDGNENPKNVNSSNSRSKNNNRRRRNAKNTNNANRKSPPSTEDSGSNTNAPNATADTNNAKGNENPNQNSNNGKKPRQQQRQRQRGNKKGGDSSNEKGGENGGVDTKSNDANVNANTKGNTNTNTNNQQPTNTKRKQKKRKPKKKYPWRRNIPEGTVDPITLDNLDTLEYPPFALCVDAPYVPVTEWPVPSEASTKNPENNKGNGNGNGKDNVGTDSTSPPPQQEEDVEDLNRQRLADIWGEHLLPSKERKTTSADDDKKQKQSSSTLPPPPLSQRPLNLFDGRALAFYMVSQLQFIDPFTRRDLTRAELQNLDRYLDRYGSAGLDADTNDKNIKNRRNTKKKKQKLKVTDAYDAKGITLSSAGAAAATAQGRADIMQQTAHQLLNSLFVGQSSVSLIAPSESAPTNERQSHQSRRQQAETFSLQEQYAATQRQERDAAALEERQYERGFGTVNGGFLPSHGDGGFGGFMVIDDDENPELRGRSHNEFPSLGATSPPANGPTSGRAGSSPFYSASHISGQHGGHRLATESGAFPALTRPTAEASPATNPPSSSSSSSSAVNGATSNDNTNRGKPAAKSKKSKTLSKISGIVKKTTVEEKQRQWEAREAARRKAMISNLTFGMNPVVADPSRSLLAPPASGDGAASGSATEEQLQRNRAFAEALGVKPATERHYTSGWARPTTTEGAGNATNHELLDELDAALYPDALIVSAREHRMDFLLKLEKRWKRFLNDDKAASFPLNRMDRPTRKFTHGYAEFWNLKTESFDPEPNRYIHCVKLPGTRMPQPLLSDIARNWRGPSSLPLPDATRTISSVIYDHTLQQTAGQSSRAPAPMLKLRSATAMSSSKGDLVALGEAAVQNSRSDLLMDKERTQLKLLPRTVPLELPSYEEKLQQEATAALDLDEDLRRRQVRLEEKRRRQREIEQKKKKALEDAFASDEEESDKEGAAWSDGDSEWGGEQEAVFVGSDEE